MCAGVSNRSTLWYKPSPLGGFNVVTPKCPGHCTASFEIPCSQSINFDSCPGSTFQL